MTADDHKDDSDFKQIEATRVDLGDDLIEKTAMLPGVASATPTPGGTPESEAEAESEFKPPSVDLDDQLHSAVILMNEGMLEDAKKLLRKILIVDPHRVVARQTLDEIHALELKQIFGEDRRHRIRGRQKPEEAVIDSEAVMRKLDQDLQLGVFDDGDRGEPLGTAMSIFQSPAAMKKFESRVDDVMTGAGARDRIDLGIAFLEMGLYDVAVRLFQGAALQSEHVLAATALLAYALILAGRPFEALMCAEPMLTDSDLGPDDRIEFMYLLGRANEGLRKQEESLLWYSRVRELEPHYRDVGERMRALTERAKKQR